MQHCLLVVEVRKPKKCFCDVNYFTLKSETSILIFRAAANIKLEKLDVAIEDCKKALSLNPSYARAHGRLG